MAFVNVNMGLLQVSQIVGVICSLRRTRSEIHLMEYPVSVKSNGLRVTACELDIAPMIV
jgi:hypothetical protein